MAIHQVNKERSRYTLKPPAANYKRLLRYSACGERMQFQQNYLDDVVHLHQLTFITTVLLLEHGPYSVSLVARQYCPLVWKLDNYRSRGKTEWNIILPEHIGTVKFGVGSDPAALSGLFRSDGHSGPNPKVNIPNNIKNNNPDDKQVAKGIVNCIARDVYVFTSFNVTKIRGRIPLPKVRDTYGIWNV